jgi:hypothetical protein
MKKLGFTVKIIKSTGEQVAYKFQSAWENSDYPDVGQPPSSVVGETIPAIGPLYQNDFSDNVNNWLCVYNMAYVPDDSVTSFLVTGGEGEFSVTAPFGEYGWYGVVAWRYLLGETWKNYSFEFTVLGTMNWVIDNQLSFLVRSAGETYQDGVGFRYTYDSDLGMIFTPVNLDDGSSYVCTLGNGDRIRIEVTDGFCDLYVNSVLIAHSPMYDPISYVGGSIGIDIQSCVPDNTPFLFSIDDMLVNAL